MFGKPTVRFEPDLYQRAALAASRLGHESVDRYVASVIERDLKARDDEDARQKVLQKMKGLGYLQ